MDPDLSALLPSWQLALRAEQKSPRTVTAYADGVAAFIRWCGATGIDTRITKTNAQAFVVGLLESGAQSSTARSRFISLRLFADWAVAEGEIDTNPLAAGSNCPSLIRRSCTRSATTVARADQGLRR